MIRLKILSFFLKCLGFTVTLRKEQMNPNCPETMNYGLEVVRLEIIYIL